MEKLKNFIYDKSDLLVALVIVAAAALIIWLGINNIMKPYTESAEAKNLIQSEEPADVQATQGAANTQADTPPAVQTPPAETTAQPTKVVIQAGDNSDDIAEKLLTAGVITDKNTFYAKLDELGLSSKIQLGTFEIPAGSTLDDVCKIVTKTN